MKQQRRKQYKGREVNQLLGGVAIFIGLALVITLLIVGGIIR